MSLGDAQAIKDLAASLRSADSETRRNAFSRITNSSRDLIDGILPALLEVAKDPDPAIRSSVYLTLADLAFGNDTARAVVFSALIDPDQFARRQAAEAILNRRIFLNRDVNKQVQQAVEKAVESSDPLIRQAALHALFDSGMAKSDKMLMGLFQDSNPSVRIKAMKASAFIERPEFVSAFVKALSDQDAGVRRLALSNFRYKRAPDSSFEQVRTLLRSDTLEDVRAEAAQALTYSTHPDSLSALVEALKDPSARVRIAVLESLGTASNEHAAKVVAAVTPLALGEPSQEVRAAAIVALRNHRPDNLLQILNEVITNATSETLVRVKAVSALDYVRNDDERAAGEIARALLRNDSDPKVREQAAQVLGYIKAEAFKEDFISALSDPSEEVQAAAIAGLGKIGTVEVIQSLLPLFERATGPMRDRLESGMKEAALRSVRRINEMHDSTEFSEATRYASVANVDRKVLYHLMVLAEEELFTSTYNGLYSRLRDKMRTGTPVNGAQLLEENGNYGFRDFLKLASNYNQLDNFLQTMDVPLQEGLIKRFATGFHKERDRLEQAVAVADTIGTLTNARVLRTVADTLEQNFKQLETTDKRSADLYGLLGALYKDRSVTTPWLQEANKDYQLPDLSKLDVNALFQPNGKHIQHHFFYHDEGKAPDGTNSFNHFKATYAGRPGWNMETHDGYIIIRSTGPKVVEIYANDPTVDEKGIDSILARFKESNIEPQAVFHRGHSYHVHKTLRHLKPSVKLVSLGSCGGYNNVNEVLSKAPEAAIISTKGVGTMLVNDPLFKLLNDHLRTGQPLVWGQFWGMVERQPFAGNRDFRNYIPPHKNYGVTYLVAERRLSQLSKTSQ
jgi:HEAT repeat protein